MYTLKKRIAIPLLKSGAKYITIFNPIFINLAPPFLKVEKVELTDIFTSSNKCVSNKYNKYS